MQPREMMISPTRLADHHLSLYKLPAGAAWPRPPVRIATDPDSGLG